MTPLETLDASKRRPDIEKHFTRLKNDLFVAPAAGTMKLLTSARRDLRGGPVASSGLWEQAQPRIAERSGHGVNGCLEGRRERQAGGHRQPRLAQDGRQPLDAPGGIYLESVRRIQAILAVCFFVLLVEPLLEREARQAMKRLELDSLPLYPERPALSPADGTPHHRRARAHPAAHAHPPGPAGRGHRRRARPPPTRAAEPTPAQSAAGCTETRPGGRLPGRLVSRRAATPPACAQVSGEGGVPGSSAVILATRRA